MDPSGASEHTLLGPNTAPSRGGEIWRKSTGQSSNVRSLWSVAGSTAMTCLFAVAGVAGFSHRAVSSTNSRPTMGGARVGEVGTAPAVNPAVAIDFAIGPLTSAVRNAALLGELTVPSTPAPECAKICLLDGIVDERLELDSSFCYGMRDTEIGECVDEECGAVGRSARRAYDAFVEDLCPNGLDVDPPSVATAARTIARSSTSTNPEPNEVEKYTEDGGEDVFVSQFGKFRAGPSEIATDARPDLQTWQCDFENCAANHPTADGGVMQYVDRFCGENGGIGCEGASGGETHCRACYLGTPASVAFPGNLGYPRCPMCVCEAFNRTAEECILCSGRYTHFRLDIFRARGGYQGGWRGSPDATKDNAVAFSEISMFDERGEKIVFDGKNTVNFDGLNPNGQGPEGAVDGTLGEKFLDARFASNGVTSMMFPVNGSPTMVRGYELFTALNSPSRDPAAWALSGAQGPDGPWMEFSRIDSANPPTMRAASYGVFDPCKSD